MIASKIILIAVYSLVIISFPITGYSQDTTFSILDYKNIRTSDFVGQPVKSLLAAIKEDYKFYSFDIKEWGWLNGIRFTYPYTPVWTVR